MKLNIDEALIANEVKKYSKVFLENMGGFYPFAIAMKKDKQIVSIGAYEGHEFPESQSLISLLEKSIPEEILKNNYIIAAICIDIFIHETINGVDAKKDAIEMRFINSSSSYIAYMPYIIDNGIVTFEDVYCD